MLQKRPAPTVKKEIFFSSNLLDYGISNMAAA
jgi:hypothetical protein